ncbi:MAG: glycosyltransferase, partial [Pyrobaculum sp.]
MEECVAYFVNYNSGAILPIEYASLRVASEDCLIYLIDNGSTDGSGVALVEFLKSSGANFVFLRLPRNLGFSRAINYAFRKLKSQYRYFVLLNNDLVPVKGILRKLVDV